MLLGRVVGEVFEKRRVLQYTPFPKSYYLKALDAEQGNDDP